MRAALRPTAALTVGFLGLTAVLATQAGAVTRKRVKTRPVTVTAGTTDQQFAARLAALPERMGLGVVAQLDATGTRGWMGNSGVPWDYAYHYLTGLGGTANWTVWEPGARYPIDFAASAKALHAIPVFSYFQIDHAGGGCGGCSTIARNLTNLDSTSVMSAWFSDFRTLLQRLSSGQYGGITGYGGTAIVHVEPDLSGYVQQALLNPSECPGTCRTGGTGPSDVKAAVASTGDKDLARFANTYAGFNQAVLALRDKYAPNVLLGYHVSNWAGKWNIGLNTSPTINYLAVANAVATFAAQSGAANVAGQRHYDLIFNDVADGDAGAYETQQSNPNTWWDSDNITLPNFVRWERFLGRISSSLHLPVMVWQVPIGNQYFLTEDNTYGHTQDNRLQYFMDHPRELRDIGVWSVMFGSGPGSTKHWDARGDGVYNANVSRLCSSRGHSTGPVCWSNVSSSTDDDGGYLRMRGAGYYTAGALPAYMP